MNIYKLCAILLIMIALPAWTHGNTGGVLPSAPTLSSINPTNGSTTGGTLVTLNGTFPGVTAVNFGATPAAGFSCSSSILCTAVSPAGTGTNNITVVNAGGTSGGSAFTYAGFTQSFTAGNNDPNGNLMDGTEMRGAVFTTIPNGAPLPSTGESTNCAIVAGCKVLFGFTGFWEDNNCANGQGPQAIALTSTFGNWYLDNNFKGLTTCGGAFFNVVNASYEYCVTYDGNGSPVSPCVHIVLASGASHSTSTLGNTFYARNNTLGTWSTFPYTPGDAGGAIRAFSDHEDDTGANPIDYLLVGSDNGGGVAPDGLVDATWLASPWGYTLPAAPESFCAKWASGTTCTTLCSPSYVTNCTNQNNDWPFNLAITSGSSTGSAITLHWASGSALIGPLSPNLSQVIVAGMTGCSGTPTNATVVVTAQTSTSLTYTSTGSCTGYTAGTITTGVKSCGTVVTCGLPQERITSITDCPVTSGGNTAGKATFFSVQMNVWRRVDNGSSSFDRLVGVVPWTGVNGGAGNGTGGQQVQLRGMTCVATADSTNYPNGYELLSHIEGDGRMWAMNPDTGIWLAEANLTTVLTNQWGWGGYQIDLYNSQGLVPITINGNPYYVGSEGDAYTTPLNQPYEAVTTGGRLTAFAGFWVRYTDSPASASAPAYRAFPLNQAQQNAFLNTFAQKVPNPPAGGGYGGLGFNACAPNCAVQISTRTGPFVSQFPEDGSQVLFFGGFDANTTPVHSTAWIARAPISIFEWP